MSTTDEQIARVLELDAAVPTDGWELWEGSYETVVREGGAMGGAVIAYADAIGEPTTSEYRLIAEYRTLAPILARKLERAMEAVRYYETSEDYLPAAAALTQIEEMKMTHALQGNETLSVDQANILDKYLVAVPGYTTNAVIRRKFEQMARELSMLGYEVGYVTGWNESCDYNG